MPRDGHVRALILQHLALYPEGLRRLKLCTFLNGLHPRVKRADFEPALAALVAEGLVREERSPLGTRGRPWRTYFLARKEAAA